MIETGLAGKVALVTGGNNPLGIGAAIAIALAAEGVRVALAFQGDRADESFDHLEPGAERYAAATAADGHQVRDRIRAAGGAAELLPVDLADPAACAALFDRAEEALGPVDILVNNAAYCEPDTLKPTAGWRLIGDSVPLTAAGLDAHFAVNTRAPALLMAEYHRRQLARGAGWGRVINISTDGAPVFPGEVSYGATKNALESLSRSAAHELAAAGITVNIIAPGAIQTGWVSADMVEAIERGTPLGRVGRPDDVADVAVFLASEQARWLTGQTLYVGGGHRMV